MSTSHGLRYRGLRGIDRKPQKWYGMALESNPNQSVLLLLAAFFGPPFIDGFLLSK